MPSQEREVVLSGGNTTPVVRIGQTVRRATGPWTPAIHALLGHLRASGFRQVPEPRGLARGVWDISYAAYRFVPLTDPANPDVPYLGVAEQARRLAEFCSSYRSPRIGPRDVVATAPTRLRELVGFIVGAAAAGDPAQRAVLERGDTAIYERDVACLERHRERLTSG
jgi:hypothetical protein